MASRLTQIGSFINVIMQMSKFWVKLILGRVTFKSNHSYISTSNCACYTFQKSFKKA